MYILVLLLGTFATYVSTNCYSVLFLLPNWCCRGNSLPTHVTGFGQGSLGATRIGCRVKETDASVFRFKAVLNLGNSGIFDHRCQDSTNITCPRKIDARRKKNLDLQLTKQKHQEDQNEHQWFIGHRRKVTYLDFEWRACVAEYRKLWLHFYVLGFSCICVN